MTCPASLLWGAALAGALLTGAAIAVVYVVTGVRRDRRDRDR